MRISVIGATGGIGREVVTQAQEAGFDVVAAVRNPAAVPPGARIERVDVFDPVALAEVIDGSDAVVSALGPRKDSPTSLLTDGVRAALAAMDKTGVERLVVVSAAGAFVEPEDGLVVRGVAKPLLGRLLRRTFTDVRAMEAAVVESHILWTIIRPPRLLDRPGTDHYRLAVGRGLTRASSIPRADVAAAILECLWDGATRQRVVRVAS